MTEPALKFAAPEPETPKTRVHPVFLSFRGCPVRCVFCAQTLQSGQAERGLDALLAALDEELRAAQTPREVAFYGGTFTSLPFAEQLACLHLAEKHKRAGRVTRVRASTRPDAVTRDGLARLREAGLDLLELGVQSFGDTALAASSRGYTGETAAQGCALVAESGLALGVQLMPGMPGMDEEIFTEDVRAALACKPEVLRLYPCLVLAGTKLAAMFTQGQYTPWPLEPTVKVLATAQLGAWEAGTRVIRIGLAPQAELDQGGVLAGPRHPALGSMVRGLALFRYIRGHLAGVERVAEFSLPKRFQGEFWGHKGELRKAYADIGIMKSTVRWWDKDHFEAHPA
ncbi:radical SAM protein [Desulfovibrio sp. OttesenSCG-928-O18]|nr:radical SAM protein [Desulfovibrio sp. OttesenSCG-928-O18]